MITIKIDNDGVIPANFGSERGYKVFAATKTHYYYSEREARRLERGRNKKHRIGRKNFLMAMRLKNNG